MEKKSDVLWRCCDVCVVCAVRGGVTVFFGRNLREFSPSFFGVPHIFPIVLLSDFGVCFESKLTVVGELQQPN